jgi:hypothetical protein
MNEPNAEPGRRRRRRRGPPGADVPTPTDLARAAEAAKHSGPPDVPARRPRTTEAAESKGKSRRRDSAGLRGLVGAGPSQLGVSGALRGRDVNRPTDEDLAEAERDVQLVRRHWKPPS